MNPQHLCTTVVWPDIIPLSYHVLHWKQFFYMSFTLFVNFRIPLFIIIQIDCCSAKQCGVSITCWVSHAAKQTFLWINCRKRTSCWRNVNTIIIESCSLVRTQELKLIIISDIIKYLRSNNIISIPYMGITKIGLCATRHIHRFY